VIALVCLLASMSLIAVLQTVVPSVFLWIAMVAMLPIFVVLWLLERFRSWFFSVTYLIVGTASMYWVVLVGTSQFPGVATTDSFILTLPKIALIFVGGTGIGVLRVIAWSTAGYVLGEAATIAGALQTGAIIALDVTALVVYIGVVALLAIIGVSRQRVQRAQPGLHRAARDEHLSDMRHRLELRAAAMMHDTILNHLAAVSASPDGELRSELRERVERDLETLVGEEWLLDSEIGEDAAGRDGWYASRFSRSLDEARDLGLDVVLSGDRTAITRLTAQRRLAVALAVKQCLVNVVKHAETDRAEVVIYGAGSEVTVMVIDGGKGFLERETSVDRLGLRQSVRKRIEAVDGTVQVWSTPGTGTSVLIRLPVAADDHALETAS
jgi:signal transduction histidine kinase